MDLCYIKPEKLIRLKRVEEIKIEFVGANSQQSGLIERHYIVNGSKQIVIAGVDSMTLEQDYDQIRRFYKSFMLLENGNM